MQGRISLTKCLKLRLFGFQTVSLPAYITCNIFIFLGKRQNLFVQISIRLQHTQIQQLVKFQAVLFKYFNIIIFKIIHI